MMTPPYRPAIPETLYRMTKFILVSTCLMIFNRHERCVLWDVFCFSAPPSQLASLNQPSAAENNLFIFGYGNVGSSVADIASRVIIRSAVHNESCSPWLGGIHVDDATTAHAFEETSFPAFSSISATVRLRSEADFAADLPEAQNEGAVCEMEASSSSVSLVNLLYFQDSIAVAKHLSKATHVLVTIPLVPSTKLTQQATVQGEKSSNDANYEDVILSSHYNYFDLIPPNAWVGYVSTTGVYGHHDGNWVNETSEPRARPFSKAWAYLQIEMKWKHELLRAANRRQTHGWRKIPCFIIFRCAALYGNRSSAIHTAWRSLQDEETESDTATASITSSDLISTMKKGSTKTNNAKDEFATSRIHLTDASRSIILAMLLNCETSSDNSLCCSVYNLADNDPAPRSIVMAYAKQLLLQEELLQQPHDTEPKKLRKSSFSQRKAKDESNYSERRHRQTIDNKRVSNEKILKLLHGYGGLLYPSYREGLFSILQQANTK